MKKPSNRKERINMIIQKLGLDFVSGMYSSTDKEIKEIFESIYPKLIKMPDFVARGHLPVCKRCGVEVDIEFHTYCQCGMDRTVYNEEEWERDIEDHTEKDRLPEDAAFVARGYKLN